MTAIFVTATGTDIGKTFVTAGLIRALRARGRPASALKPVVSGFEMTTAEDSDPGQLLQAMGQTIAPHTVARISPWRFVAPLSPDMAAARENREIAFAELVAFCRDQMNSTNGALLIEGVGGVMVPLDRQHTVLDWIAALDIPVLLIVGTYLGTISHTLTALHALRSRGVVVRTIALNESAAMPAPVVETAKSIRHFADPVPVLTVPRGSDARRLDASLVELLQSLAMAE
jgi:dethiobiotin synthetase